MSSQCTLPDAVAYADGAAEDGCAPGTATGTTTIMLPAASSDYLVTSTLHITAKTQIIGGGAAQTVISGGGAVEVLFVQDAIASISGVTITDGMTSDQTTGCGADGCPSESGGLGGGINNLGNLTLTDDVVSDNHTAAGVGPTNAFCSRLAGCEGQSAGDGGTGGGIVSQGMLTITGSTITDNSAGQGGNGTGGQTSATGGPGENGGDGGNGGVGGGIFNGADDTLTISDSTISGNSAGAGGNAGGGSTAHDDDGAAGGSAGSAGSGGMGGGIFNAGQTTITDSTISGNHTGAGGDGAGGGDGYDGGSAGSGSVSGAGGPGGGIEDEPPGIMAPNFVTLTNDTIAANTAAAGGTGGTGSGLGGFGGGIDDDLAGSITMSFSTVAGNEASVEGNQVNVDGSTLTESASIIASSGELGANCSSDGGDDYVDGGGNIDFGDSGPATCPGTAGDPKLGPPAANGGPVETMALGSGSAAIGVVPPADCSQATDARGIARPQGSDCDAGAYQYAVPAISSPSATSSSSTAAAVSASIDPNLSAHDTIVTVKYGTTNAYGSPSAGQDIGDGDVAVSFAGTLSGLAPATRYDYEIVATNGDGSATSTGGSFTTAPAARIVSVSTMASVLTLGLRCGATAGERCDGPLALESGRQTVARGSYSVAAGAIDTVTLALDRAGLKLLARRYALTVWIAIDRVTQRRVTFRYALIHARIALGFTQVGDVTSVQKPRVSGIPARAKVEVICHGGGCPFARRALKVKHGKASGTGALRGHRLKVGAKLTVEVTKSGEVGEVVVFTIRRSKPPKTVHDCLPPGLSRPTACD